MSGAAAPEPNWATLPTSGASLGLGRDRMVRGDGIRLHAVERGRGPLVVLLHGFPDFSYAWRHQLPALADAGFRAVALDLRGYNLSDRPTRVEDYTLDRLTADVAAAVRDLGGPAHAIVAHDWGGVIAWRLSVSRPDAFARLVALNAPQPARYRELLTHTWSQVKRSWYVAAFQVPGLPERMLRANDLALLETVWRREHARPDALSRRDVAVYKRAFADPGALPAAIAYYRALGRTMRSSLSMTGRTRHPMLVVWGDLDGALVPENADRLERWVPDVRVLRVPDAAHWVMVDAPERVNAALIDFLAGPVAR